MTALKNCQTFFSRYWFNFSKKLNINGVGNSQNSKQIITSVSTKINLKLVAFASKWKIGRFCTQKLFNWSPRLKFACGRTTHGWPLCGTNRIQFLYRVLPSFYLLRKWPIRIPIEEIVVQSGPIWSFRTIWTLVHMGFHYQSNHDLKFSVWRINQLCRN